MLKYSALKVTAFIALLCAIEIVDRNFGLDLYRFGVYPGELYGLRGIVFAPLLHGSWDHLASNSFGLMLLGTVLLYRYPRAAWPALVLVYVGSGIGVWLFARHSVLLLDENVRWLDVTVDHATLMRVLDRATHLRKQLQPFVDPESFQFAILGHR